MVTKNISESINDTEILDSDASWSTIDEEEQDFNYSRDEELSNDASTSQLAIETTSTD